jgi:hypothetical protein
MNDTNEKNAEEKLSELQQIEFFVCSASHTHASTNLHSNLSINNFVTTLKRNTAFGVATSHSVFRELF